MPTQDVLVSNDTIRNLKYSYLQSHTDERIACLSITTLLFIRFVCDDRVGVFHLSKRHREDYCLYELQSMMQYYIIIYFPGRSNSNFYLKFQYNKSNKIYQTLYIVVVASFFQDPREGNRHLPIPVLLVFKNGRSLQNIINIG